MVNSIILQKLIRIKKNITDKKSSQKISSKQLNSRIKIITAPERRKNIARQKGILILTATRSRILKWKYVLILISVQVTASFHYMGADFSKKKWFDKCGYILIHYDIIDSFWFNVIQRDPTWLILIQFDPVWSRFIRTNRNVAQCACNSLFPVLCALHTSYMSSREREDPLIIMHDKRFFFDWYM